MAVELFEKGDVEVLIEGGKLKIVVGQADKIQAGVTVPFGYVLDKIEELIPGDQKAAFGAIKVALGA